MALDWLRLWHTLPTDPKFRTISKLSNQPIPTVIAIYVFMLCDASANANERGRTQTNDEDIASALDLDHAQISSVREHMQGRLLDDDFIKGWAARQPEREDGSAGRSKAWRELQKLKEENELLRTQTNAGERKRTLDKDKDKIKKNTEIRISVSCAFDEFYKTYPKQENEVAARKVWTKKKLDSKSVEIIADVNNRKEKHSGWKDKKFIPAPNKYLEFERWNDEITEEPVHANKKSYAQRQNVVDANYVAARKSVEKWHDPEAGLEASLDQ